MQIDNSAFVAYQTCPMLYYERYLRKHTLESAVGGIELDAPKPDRDFGTRFHNLLHIYHVGLCGSPEAIDKIPIPAGVAAEDGDIEAECQSTWERYLAHYPVEPLQFISAERTELVPLPGTRHRLIVKIDAVVRHSDGTIGPYDAKTERPRSQSNDPEVWAAKSQATLYLYATQQLYPQERVTRMVVDVITRGGPKTAPLFRRLDDITRTPERIQETLRNLIHTADQIELHTQTGWWPRNEISCKQGWKRCDFYPLHVFPGESERTLQLYKPAEAYLNV